MAVISHGNRTGGRLPRGPHRLTSDQVAADQRQRLIDAMLQLAGGDGYAATTVADVIGRAEVSRKTFYAHFADREGLLLAAFDATSPVALEEVRAASRRTGGPTRRIEALMRRLCRVGRESPSAIALSTIEIAAIDPAGLQRHARLMADYGELIDECLRVGAEQPALPSALARALAGGAFRAIDARLRTGRAVELTALAPELARWTRGYHPVPPGLTADEAPPTWSCAGSDGLVGGRAPGTLTLAADGYRPPRAARSPGFIHHSNRERILDAVAQLTTARGYTSLTAQSIAEHADVSERAFLAHFKNKDDAFAAAVEIGHMKGQAIVDRARAGAPDWRAGVRRAICALVEFLASEPCFTRLAFVDAPLAGPAMASRAYAHTGAYARLLLDGAPQRRRPPPVAAEAAVHGLFELAFHHAAQHKTTELPRVASEATYLALAPFVGVTEAAQAAAEQGRRVSAGRQGS
jgi:AcrR family transcriptional regulator